MSDSRPPLLDRALPATMTPARSAALAGRVVSACTTTVSIPAVAPVVLVGVTRYLLNRRRRRLIGQTAALERQNDMKRAAESRVLLVLLQTPNLSADLEGRRLIGDAEREATLERLRDRRASGHLTPDELDQRTADALSARTRAQLAHVMRDLP